MNMKSPFHNLLKLAALLTACLFLASCFSINYSTKGGYIPPEAKTFSVQYIENQARIVEPNLSQELTDKLKDYLQGNTTLTLVNRDADIDFEAVITTYEPDKPVAITSGDEAAKNRFTIGVKVKMTCVVKPEIDFEGSFSRFEDYSSSENFESLRADLTTKMLELILDDIYKKAFVNW